MKKLLLLLAAAAGAAAGVVMWQRRGSVAAHTEVAETWPSTVAAGTAPNVADRAPEVLADTDGTPAATADLAQASAKKAAPKKAPSKKVAATKSTAPEPAE